MWAKLISAAMVIAITISVASAADEIHEGKVVMVSDSKLMVFDKRDGENDVFIVTADTKITRNGKPTKLSDIQAGDMAKVTAVSQGDKLIAKEIIAAAPA